MFTGLITDIGVVSKIETRGDTLFRIDTMLAASHLTLGASISCSGACMTVTNFALPDVDRNLVGWFEFEASAESLDRTTLKHWNVNSRVNLEGSLALGDAMGGHLVSGHVDGLAIVEAIDKVGDSHRVRIGLPTEFAPFVAEKGSISLNGVSLTVNQVERHSFQVNIIPHTWDVTTFGDLKVGQQINFEVDMLARYVRRMLEFKV